MGELWRSEEMQLVQLFFQLEAAYETMDELGELGSIQFIDMNEGINQFQRHFANDIKRADELERKLRFFMTQIEREQEVLDSEFSPTHLEFFGDVPLESTTAFTMTDLEAQFEDHEAELHDLNNSIEAMKRNWNELLELEQVLAKGVDFFNQAGEGIGRPEEDLLDDLADHEAAPFRGMAQLGFITGIIPKSKLLSFERVIWRATLGNVFMKHADADAPLEDLETGLMEDRIVFIIFYHGSRLKDKVSRICDSFNANIYPCPDSPHERLELLEQVRTRMSDLNEVMGRSHEAKIKILSKLSPQISKWKTRLMKEKAIHHSLNMCNFDVGRKCLIAEGWVPKAAIGDTHAALKRAQHRSASPIPSILNVLRTQDEPPTFFRVNKFTAAFQGIVDSYGVARYREVNPGPFTIITFPFLFGVMFGDVGHGLLMFLFALYLVLREKKLAGQKLNEMISYCYHGRYLLLLMGVFSIYCGFIYNEVFAIPMDLFGTRWTFKGDDLNASWGSYNTAYPFGVDPAWKGAKNELVFYNSLKMKLSIIFGVTQMIFGIILSLFNGLHFNKPYNIYFEFIPQMIFMLCVFGYMCLLIIVKWCTDFVQNDRPAPYLLNVMIDMFLHPFTLPEHNQLYSGQLGFQVFFLILAVLSVPCMLFIKPYMLRRDHKRGQLTRARALPMIEEENADFSSDGGDEEEGEEFDFGEVFIHQVIHTIEFVLGGISNTASYLRLWALSLAHSELATVFWERIMVAGIEYGHYTVLAPIIAFLVWAGITAGILLCMEGLSAFLHALRLHWVEFQNKFYAGDGKKFIPFSYRLIQESEDSEY